MKRIALAFVLLILSVPTFAQSGKFTAGHAIRATGNGAQYSDGGGAAGSATPGAGYLTELGITNTGLPLCINDALTSAAGGYHSLCFGANALGGGMISYQNNGGATALPLYFNVNGDIFQAGAGGSGPLPTSWSSSNTALTQGPSVVVQALSFTHNSSVTQSAYITDFNRLILGNPFSHLPWLTAPCDQSGSLCDSTAPILLTFGDLCCGDLYSFGALTSEGIQGIQVGTRMPGSQPGGPTTLNSGYISPHQDNFGGASIEAYTDSPGSSGSSDYRMGSVTLVAGGTGYSVGSIFTIETGGSCSTKPTGRVLTVSSGVATTITIHQGLGGRCTSAATGTLNTTTVSGGGAGITVTGVFGVPPHQGLEGAIQLVSYNSDPDGHQVVRFYGRGATDGSLQQLANLTEEALVLGTTPYPVIPTIASGIGAAKLRALIEGDTAVQIPPGGGNGNANLWFIDGSNNKLAALEAQTGSGGALTITDYNTGDIVFRTISGGVPVEKGRFVAAAGLTGNSFRATGIDTTSGADTTVLDFVVGGSTSRWRCFGHDLAANGNCQIQTVRSDGSSPATAVTITQGGEVFFGTNATVGASAQIATTATSPFFYTSTMAGAPTGAPTLTDSGKGAITIDTTNHKICWYEQVNTAWKCAAGT